eukprot:SAG31_NODE_17797_length_657_cov_1.168459_1_plen_56_part_10
MQVWQHDGTTPCRESISAYYSQYCLAMYVAFGLKLFGNARFCTKFHFNVSGFNKLS